MSSAQESRLSHDDHADADSIAVVGIGCRYADARGPDEFWEIVRSGRDTVRDAPPHRVELGYDIDHFYDPRPRIPGKISSKKGGFLEHPELFDPTAFGIAPRDALTMEPQQRLMVEVTWDALADAGVVPEAIVGERVAVLLGYMAEDYSRERAGVLGEEVVYRGHDVFTVGGMSHAVLSGRIAFLLGVTGPSLTLDTACSSSLIATHLACQTLRRGESNMAIAGGVNLFLSPEGNIALSRSGMLSLSGACRAFDASADGFVRAEGAGVVVLKRLRDAVADGNPIYAVIRGSGISSDGRDGGHMMAPGRSGQAQAMHDAYAEAGIDPATIQYVETHGTGTMIGDPVEIAALADVMGPGRDPDRPLLVASVKGNLGHTESASGVAGLIKACLAIRHRELPAQLHFETPNPMIPWDEVPIRVQTQTTPWPDAGKALVGVNSFGISGTNAHVVLESPPPDSARPPTRRSRTTGSERVERATRPLVLPITGHDPNALHDMVEATRERIAHFDDGDIEDLAYTYACHRSQRAHRFCVTAEDAPALRRELDAYLAGQPGPAIAMGQTATESRPDLVMLFPGQGSQWLGMGRDLLAREPVFADAIARIDGAYRRHVDWSLHALLAEASPATAERGGAKPDWTERLDVLQPVLVAVEIALAALWASWGIRPTRVVGQSMGEIAAAHVAGILTLDDVARLVCHRGRIVARATGRGAMAVVALPREAAQARIDHYEAETGMAARFASSERGEGATAHVDARRLEVAGVNSPTTTIVSGDRDALIEWIGLLEDEGVFVRRLDVDFASHCFHMDPLLDDFRSGIASIAPRAGTIPFDSTVDGEQKRGEALDADYWVRNLRAPVALVDGLAPSLEAGCEVFLEVSPHPTLPRAIEEIARSAGKSARYVCSLARDEDGQTALLRNLSDLYVQGIEADFRELMPSARIVDTPLYAYQRKRFWFSERSRIDRFRPVHPLLGQASESSLDPRVTSWDFVLDADTAGCVGETRIDGRPVAPDAIALEIALAAGQALWPRCDTVVRNLELLHAIELGDTGRRIVQVRVRRRADGVAELRLASRASDRARSVDGSGVVAYSPASGPAPEWTLHARAEIAWVGACEEFARADRLDRTSAESVASDRYYEAVEAGGVEWGACGRTLRELTRLRPAAHASEAEVEDARERTYVGRMMLPRIVESEWYAFHAHPALVDGAVQLAALCLDPASAVELRAVESFSLRRGVLGSETYCRVTPRAPIAADRTAAVGALFDFAFFDREGECVARLEGASLRARPTRQKRTKSSDTGLARLAWRALPPIETKAIHEVDRWIVISDDAAQAGLLASELQKRSAECRFCEKVEDLEPLVRLMEGDRGRSWGLVLLAWGDPADRGDREPDVHRAFRVASWAEAIREHAAAASQVWIATRGLQSIDRDLERADPMRGTGRDVAREIETFTDCVEMQRCHLLDASPALDPVERLHLAALMGRANEEHQFVTRGEAIYVPRLIVADEVFSQGDPHTVATSPAGSRNFAARHVLPRDAGGIAGVVFDEAAAPELDAGDVLVEVRAAALSQLDVLADLGLARSDSPGAPAEADGIGRDFAGVVIAVGNEVTDLAVGDEVAGVQPGAVARRIAVPRARVVEKPAWLDFVEAASRPFPFLVARYALERVARLASFERVLIASGSGGVGHALESVAREIGAEVTLDGEPKPEGVDEATFDVVVGTCAGDSLDRLLSRLAPGGRYLDLSPRERFERPERGAFELGANRTLCSIDIESALRDEPGIVAKLIARTFSSSSAIGDDAQVRASREPEAAAPVASGDALPITTFPASAVARAIRYMAQNRHHGRVCLDLSEAADLAIRVRRDPSALLAGYGAFAVSGSDGALKDAIVAWLSARGADAIERPPLSAEATTAAQTAWEGRLAGGCDSSLGGWVHLSRERSRRVEANACSPEGEMESGVDGRPIDGLRESLTQSELPLRLAISIREVASAGDAARDRADRSSGAGLDRAWETRIWIDHLRRSGSAGDASWCDLSVASTAGEAASRPQLFHALDRIIGQLVSSSSGLQAANVSDRETGGPFVLMGADELAGRLAVAPSPLLCEIAAADGGGSSLRITPSEFEALTPPERRAEMTAFVYAELGVVLGHSDEQLAEIDPGRRLDSLGLDSLMTLELFTGMGRNLELEISQDWFDSIPTLAQVSATLADRYIESIEQARSA